MRVHTIGSGAYMVSRQVPEILQAYLGSCVGVTLCDRRAGVGGLIHLLLPEPPSMDLTWNPEVSAVTGMPIFLDALCRMGARRENLIACIAGGALIDPVSQADLMLDIGGRTAETVQRILANERIPVYKTEVGGYFSCCISLNLKTLDTLIEPIVIPAPRVPRRFFRTPEREQLDSVIENLLPIPQTALKIIRMINNTDCSFRELAREVTEDQVLTARIIRMCNTVSVSAKMKVDSIEKALLRIGEKNLLLLALTFSLQNFISHANQGYSLCKGGLFHHSIWTANLSGKLGEMTGKARPDLAYTAGLLHDIGKVILDQYMEKAYPLFYRHVQIDGKDLLETEKELFGLDHAEAGHYLGSRWDMPEFITETTLHHHDPENANGNRDLAHLICVADLVSHRLMPGGGLEKLDTSHLRPSLEALGLSMGSLPELLAGSPMASAICES